jgi:hypothetical protein
VKDEESAMKHTNLSAGILGAIALLGAMTIGADAKSDTQAQPGGVAAVYGNLPPDQVEFLSTPDRIMSIASSGAPTLVWETLEHGERVECADCVSAVEPLLYDANAKNREIAAWWLRRRIFGVFGPGETYEKTLTTLASDADPQRRAHAAEALGEFLATSGIPAVATALKGDADARVRAASASALGRLNDDGAGALTAGLADGDESVRLAALTAAGRVSTIADAGFLPGVVKLVGDQSATVRKHAVMLLDGMAAKDSVASVMQLAKADGDEDVRIAACHALATFGDVTAQATLQYIAQNDASSLVRDMATIALLRM